MTDLWRKIGKLPASRAKTAILQLAKTVDRDPALAAQYVDWLALGMWPAPTAKIVWERIFAHLVALRDGSVVARLREIAAALPPFVGAAHRAWLTAEIGRVADQLAKAPGAKAARRQPAPPKQPADPLAKIWADPDDADLRLVVADALTERGDVRGEYIALACIAAPSAKQRSRLRALEREHAAAWLGAIERLALAGSWELARGFPSAVALDRRAVPRREWDAALAAPEWATIRRVCVSILHTPKWWITAWVKSPASGRVLAFEIGSLAGRPALRVERAAPDRPWRVATAVRGNTSSGVPILRAFVAGLPARAPLELAPDLANREAYAAAVARRAQRSLSSVPIDAAG